MDGNVHMFESRLVTKGYTQNQSIDYKKNLSPIARIKSIRILLFIVAFCDYEVWKIDLKVIFLNKKIIDDIYMA